MVQARGAAAELVDVPDDVGVDLLGEHPELVGHLGPGGLQDTELLLGLAGLLFQRLGQTRILGAQVG